VVNGAPRQKHRVHPSRTFRRKKGIGRAKGEVEHDEEGLRTMQALGQNMAWLLKKING
jgi:hypothetical protein